MKRAIALLAALLACAAVTFGMAGPAAAGLTDILDQAREKIGPVLLGRDILTLPDQEVTLEASLRSGLRLTGIEGKRVQFLLDNQTLGEVRTNKSGDVAVKWKVPAKPGDYRITVRLNPQDQPEKPIADTDLLLGARKAETPMVVVDLDRTVVASGFTWVLLGGAKPMAGSSTVMQHLAKDHTVVYLTHRIDFLGPSSKQWLTDNGFPAGPVLTSTLGGLLSGSGTYKTGRLEAIRQTFKNVAVGIGDKCSDAKAYADNGMRAILILQVDWSETDPEYYEKVAAELAALPDAVQVVSNWSQISAILFNKVSCPKQEMETRIRDLAKELRARKKD